MDKSFINSNHSNRNSCKTNRPHINKDKDKFSQIDKSIKAIKYELDLIWKKIDDDKKLYVSNINRLKLERLNGFALQNNDSIIINVKNKDGFQAKSQIVLPSNAYSKANALGLYLQAYPERNIKSVCVKKEGSPMKENSKSGHQRNINKVENAPSDVIVAPESIESFPSTAKGKEKSYNPDDELNKLDLLISELIRIDKKKPNLNQIKEEKE